jgi:PAS domain-containing protein
MGIDNINIQLTSTDELRRIAEERMSTRKPELYLPESLEATQRIVHELEVHQIELVIQNEELRQARYEVETALEKYTDLYEFAPVGYLTLEQNGAISALNLTVANLLRIERSLLIGRSFVEFLREEFRPGFATFLKSIFSDKSNKTCEVILMNNVNLPVIVQIGAAASASGLKCRLALIDITEQRKIEKKEYQNNLEQL